MMASVRDPKDIVRRGYDLVSWAYRPDDADDGRYGAWLDLLEERVVPGSPVLDLGCGCGIPVARRLAQRYAVTRVDFSEVQIARARELVAGANFVCADMTTVTFPEDSPTPSALCSYMGYADPIKKAWSEGGAPGRAAGVAAQGSESTTDSLIAVFNTRGTVIEVDRQRARDLRGLP